MTVPGNIEALLLGGDTGYRIQRSLRFNSPDSPFLSRAFGSDGGSTWTISCWLKRSEVDTRNFSFTLMHAGAYPNPYEHIQIGSNQIIYYNDGGASAQGGRTTSAVFRDCSAWYHIVCVRQGTSQFKIYVNGVEQAAASNANPSASYALNKAATMYIGQNNNYDGGGTKYSAGYLAEYYFVSGQALTPSSFGETDTITGVWKPKKYAGTYGTNGFYLKFADNSGTTSTTLGKDSSGNGNNWTPNNFSVTAGAGNDSMIDTPTPYADGGNGRGNYCTLNPLANGGTLANGNLDATSSTNKVIYSTFALDAGKYYWEVTLNGSNLQQIGIADLTKTNTTNSAPGDSGRNGYIYLTDGKTYNNGTLLSSYSSSTTNDVIGLAYDAPSNKLWIRKNNGSWFAGGDPAAGTTPTMTTSSSYSYTAVLGAGGGTDAVNASVNFGQRAFAYTPPSGFLALNTQNLPEPSIKKPSSYFDAKLYTGNNSTQTISGLGFSPDLVWLKSRSGAFGHGLYDTVRGATRQLCSHQTSAEISVAGRSLTAFNSDGFSLNIDDASYGAYVNQSGQTQVAWCWDESATPGFDIVTYTGTSAAQNISHSLGVAPSMIITKARNSAGGNFGVYHKSVGNTGALFLNVTNAVGTNILYWNNTSPTSSVFSVGANNTDTNWNTFNMIAYLWSEVAGFSKFGSYTGNGSTDGPFVFCGFRPRWVLAKRSDASAYNWFIIDAARSPENVSDEWLLPNGSNAEQAQVVADMVSNGFKIRSSLSEFNINGGTYIFAAFAESPFKYSLAR